MKKLFENKPRAWFMLGSIFVFLITMFSLAYFGLGSSVLVANDVVAKIDGEKVLLADFKSWLYSHDNMGTSQNPGKWEEIKNNDEQKKYYIDSYVKELLMKKEASAQNITVTDVEIDEKYKVPTSNYDKLTDEQKRLSRENVKSEILKEKLENTQFGWVAGEYVLYRFDKYYDFKDEEVVVEGAGDNALIQKQRTYADRISKEAYTRLKSGETTIAAEAKNLEADPEISYKAFAPLTPHISGKSTKTEYLLNISLFDTKIYENFKSSIKDLKINEVSEPFVLRGSVNGNMQDIAYVIYQAKEKGGGQFMDGESWYTAMLDKYKVSIYYSNLGIKSVEDKTTAVNSFISNITPKAYADCSLSFNSTHGTQFLAETLVLNADGASWTRWPYARYQLQAGTSSASPQLKVWGHDCVYWGKVFNETKSARSDGYMYSSQTYWVPNNPAFPDQLAFLADCSSTSTAGITGYKPTSTAWITNSGTLTAAYACCYNWSAGGGDGEEAFAVGLNMAGYNGLTMHTAFYYQPHYNSAPTVTPTAPTQNRTFLPTDSIYINALTNDVNAGDQVNTRIAISKLGADGVTWNGWPEEWRYYETGYTAPGVDRTVKSFIPASALGVGKYKWVVTAHDWHGVYNAIPVGSPNSYNHNDPRYFEIAEEVVLAELACSVAPAEGGPVPLSVVVTVDNPRTGYEYSYDFENDNIYDYKNRGPVVSWSYAASGYYQIRVTEGVAGADPTCNDANRCAVCSPEPYPVRSNPDGTGGEVAP